MMATIFMVSVVTGVAVAIMAAAIRAFELRVRKSDRSYSESVALRLKIAQEERQMEFIQQQNLHARAFQEILVQNVDVNRVTQDLTSRLIGYWTAADGIISAKLDQIHTLVNSNMTAAMESEMEARSSNLLLMQEAVELGRRLGHEPSADTLAGITAARGKIADLGARLRDRSGHTRPADADMAPGISANKAPESQPKPEE